jgi:hypothetical protein
VLAATHHDPDGAMLAQTRRVLPRLRELYAAIVVLATPATEPRTIELLREHGAQVVHDSSADHGAETLGLKRLELLRLAAAPDVAHIHLCDLDRALHWAEQYPDELRTIIASIPRHDLLILGRTPRAFATHARVQRDTEAIVNHVFGLAFGQPLDVTAASRGFSRAAIQALLELDTPEPTIGQDCSWPLYLARLEELVIGYAATEGLEWETPDRFGDEITAAGGLEPWLAEYDADPQRWQERTQLALHEVAAINRWR